MMHLLDGTSNQLPKITGDDPQSQVLAARVGGRQRHDGTGLSNVPGPGADASEEATKDQVPLVAKFAVAVIRRASDRE